MSSNFDSEHWHPSSIGYAYFASRSGAVVHSDNRWDPTTPRPQRLEVWGKAFENLCNQDTSFGTGPAGHSRQRLWSQLLLGKQYQTNPICAFATSKPDVTFYRRTKFVVDNAIIGGVICMETDDPADDNEDGKWPYSPRFLWRGQERHQERHQMSRPGNCFNRFEPEPQGYCKTKTVIFGFERIVDTNLVSPVRVVV